jgi:hypothetical protein
LTYTQPFTPQVVNEARFGLTRTIGHYRGVHVGTVRKQLAEIETDVEMLRPMLLTDCNQEVAHVQCA